jgi:hypothetical protein
MRYFTLFSKKNRPRNREIFKGNHFQKSLFSSPGPDDVHYQMIKELPPLAKMKLLDIYNQLWIADSFQDEALAGKDPNLPTNYRPYHTY